MRLLFTPETDRWLELFAETHETRVEQGVVQVRRMALPATGGVGEQDAKELEALDLVRWAWIRVLTEAVVRARQAEKTAAWRAERRRRIENGEL